MLGIVNQTVEGYFTSVYGAASWRAIAKAMGGTPKWVSSCPYPDSQTYSMLTIGAELVGITLECALEGFGQHFVKTILAMGYDKMLYCLGGNLAQFIQHIDHLHICLSLGCPAMNAPTFKCEKVTPVSLELHYYSHRQALAPMIAGILKELAVQCWHHDLDIQQITSKTDGKSDHDVFLLTYPYQEGMGSRNLPTAQPSNFTLNTDVFAELFPFHIVLDKECRVVQTGCVISRLFPELSSGHHIGESFELRNPVVPLSFAKMMEHLHNSFLFIARATGLELKGQMIATTALLHPRTGCPKGQDVLCFLGSPRLANLDEMLKHKLFVSDLAIHDVSRDFVMLAEQRQTEADLKESFEKLTHELMTANEKLELFSKQLEVEKAHSEELLYQMLPKAIANSLRAGQKAEATHYPDVTILFSDVVGFTSISSRSTPMEVCNLLDQLYHEFDHLLESYPDIYKVETIGDAYMLVCNCTTDCDDHVDKVLECALQMQLAAATVRTSWGEPIRTRIGVHSGPVVGGIVGRRMPRFCFFGDTVNTASRMESHGLPGRIHVSEAAYQRLRNKEQFALRDRGASHIKSKGNMQTYLLSAYEDDSVLAEQMTVCSESMFDNSAVLPYLQSIKVPGISMDGRNYHGSLDTVRLPPKSLQYVAVEEVSSQLAPVVVTEVTVDTVEVPAAAPHRKVLKLPKLKFKKKAADSCVVC